MDILVIKKDDELQGLYADAANAGQALLTALAGTSQAGSDVAEALAAMAERPRRRDGSAATDPSETWAIAPYPGLAQARAARAASHDARCRTFAQAVNVWAEAVRERARRLMLPVEIDSLK